jgi:spermidine synthase
MLSRRALGVVQTLFLASGATALVYQVAWARSLSLVFGASFEAVSIVLAAFMGGLAAGGVALGRLGPRLGRPLRLYGVLEIGVAVFALLLPWLLRIADDVYLSFALEIEGTSAWLTAARVAMAIGILLLPTFCMGGTLPVLVRFAVDRRSDLGERLAGLYAINTIGAVLGALLAGFLLLPTIGVFRTELTAAATNLAIGIAAIVADRVVERREGARSRASGVASFDAPPMDARHTSGRSLWPLRLAFWGTAVAGLSSLTLEVAWSRAIVIASGANTYSFTVMLATFLLGIAIGSWMVRSRSPRRFDVPIEFGTVLALIGLASFVAGTLLPRLAEIALWLNMTVLGGVAGIRVDTTFALSFLVMIVPCVLMGIAFPLAGEARARLGPSIGPSVGDLVGLNTLGAIAGALLSGFVFLPELGLQRTTQLASAVYLGYGLVVLSAAMAVARPRWRAPAWAAAALALPLALGLALALPRWDVQRLSAVPNNDHSLLLTDEGELDFDLAMSRTKLLYVRDGRGSTVSVIEAGGVRALMINSKVVATDHVSDMQHEYLLGHLPVLLHPEPRRAAVIGLGAGLTLGGVVAHPSLEEIVVVEIEPAVKGGAQLFADLHDDALADPRVELVWQDGRNYLQTTRRTFDVITADPIHPWAQGAAYLYTTEYYALVAAHLAPGGIACQWLPLAELSREDLQSVVASFLENFEYATLWQATGDVLLIGSSSPVRVDVDRLAERLHSPKVARQLARAGLDEPLTLLTELAMDRAGMEDFARGAIRNTDDNLYLEFSSPVSIGINPARHLPAIDRYRTTAGFLAETPGATFASREAFEARLARYRHAKSLVLEAAPHWLELMAAPTVEGMEELAAAYRAAVDEAPGYRHAAFLLATTEAMLGELRRDRDDEKGAMQAFRAALAADPGNDVANLHVGIARANRGELGPALDALDRSLERRPHSVDALAAKGQVLVRMGRSEEAVETFDEAVSMRPELAAVHRLRAQALRRVGRLDDAIEAYGRALALEPDSVAFIVELTEALATAGRHADAIELLRSAKPERPVIRRRLAWLLSTSPDASVRDGAEAVRWIEPIARGSRDPISLDVWAAALAEAGRFGKAKRVADGAATLAESEERPELVARLRARAELYAHGHAIRE